MNSEQTPEHDAEDLNEVEPVQSSLEDQVEEQYLTIAKRNKLYRWITIGMYVLLVAAAGGTIFFGFRAIEKRFRSLNGQLTEQQERITKQEASTKDSIDAVNNLSQEGLKQLGQRVPELQGLFESTFQTQALKTRRLEDNLIALSGKQNQDTEALRSDLSGLGTTLTQYKADLNKTSALLEATKNELTGVLSDLKQRLSAAEVKSSQEIQAAKSELQAAKSEFRGAIQRTTVDLTQKVNSASEGNRAEIDRLKSSVEQFSRAISKVTEAERNVQVLQNKVGDLSTKIQALQTAQAAATRPNVP